MDQVPKKEAKQVPVFQFLDLSRSSCSSSNFFTCHQSIGGTVNGEFPSMTWLGGVAERGKKQERIRGSPDRRPETMAWISLEGSRSI